MLAGLPTSLSETIVETAPRPGIQVDAITKDYHTERGLRRILDRVTFDFGPGETVAVLGQNGAGKSTLMKLIGKLEFPTSGTIRNTMSTSWPLALGGGFQGSLTGNDNIRFIARIYGKDPAEIRDYVGEFSELGSYLSMPVKTYSSGMRARLMFGLSLAIDFDCYLIDEVIMVGDHRFREKCSDRLFSKLSSRAFLIASHEPQFLKEHCTKALILYKGRARVFTDVQVAVEVYHSLVA